MDIIRGEKGEYWIDAVEVKSTRIAAEVKLTRDVAEVKLTGDVAEVKSTRDRLWHHVGYGIFVCVRGVE